VRAAPFLCKKNAHQRCTLKKGNKEIVGMSINI